MKKSPFYVQPTCPYITPVAEDVEDLETTLLLKTLRRFLQYDLVLCYTK